jgi:hypothetical protein
MESLKFKTEDPIDANSQFPNNNPPLWDDVLNYNTFYIQIFCDLNCEITIYQSSTTTPTTDFSNISVINYENVNQTNIFEGQIICSQISFIVKNNTNKNQDDFFFSVIYK